MAVIPQVFPIPLQFLGRKIVLKSRKGRRIYLTIPLTGWVVGRVVPQVFPIPLQFLGRKNRTLQDERLRSLFDCSFNWLVAVSPQVCPISLQFLGRKIAL